MVSRKHGPRERHERSQASDEGLEGRDVQDHPSLSSGARPTSGGSPVISIEPNLPWACCERRRRRPASRSRTSPPCTSNARGPSSFGSRRRRGGPCTRRFARPGLIGQAADGRPSASRSSRCRRGRSCSQSLDTWGSRRTGRTDSRSGRQRTSPSDYRRLHARPTCHAISKLALWVDRFKARGGIGHHGPLPSRKSRARERVSAPQMSWPIPGTSRSLAWKPSCSKPP